MPFPLAHPAAVLPLRRYCPRFLNFPALVIGSLAPDGAYCVGNPRLETFSHSYWGSFGFSLPIGLMMIGLAYGLGQRLVPFLPENHRRVASAFLSVPMGPILIVILSLLVGSWTHLAWDSFTHTRGWVTERIPFLEMPLGTLRRHHLRVCHLLWYGCSFAGVAWLYPAFAKWKRKLNGIRGRGALPGGK